MTKRSLSPNSASSLSSLSSPVDPKVLHLVKKLVAGQPDFCFSRSTVVVSSSSSLDHVVNCLRTQNREYQRKEPTWLKRQVERALNRLANSNTSLTAAPLEVSQNTGGNSSNSSSSRKRPLELQQQHEHKLEEEQFLNAQEQRYDQEAQKHETIRQNLLEQRSGGSSSMLNASLRDRYRQVQQQRAQEEMQRCEATTADHANGEAQETTDSQPNATKSESSAPGAPPVNGKGKRIKRKKSSQKRASSGLDMAGDSNTMFTSPSPRPTERYSDLGGMHDILQQIRQLVEYPLVRPEVYRHLGVDPPRGVLLRGPPGCGKTHLANAIAGQLGLPYFRVSAPELVSGMSGESEGRIRDLFRAASDMAPALIFMDELDSIAPKRTESGASRGMEKRMVAQLLTSMDSIAPQYNRQNAPVIVLGATNRPDAMDAALRRAGRFDKEILLGVPDEEAREGILRTMTKGMRLSGDFDYKTLARKTPGYVGADVRSLTKEAAVFAINRIFHDVLTDEGAMPRILEDPSGVGDPTRFEGRAVDTSDSPTLRNNDAAAYQASNGDSPEIASVTPLTTEQMEPLYVTMHDFRSAIPLVQPSGKREGFATVPDVSWDNIGALQGVRDELTLSVLEPIRHPEKFQALGLSLPAGVLLYGPPGCGKTLLAKAIANESGANFISVKGPELLDKYVGESERAVRVVFERARSSSPCVVFFDELDSLCPRRGSDGGGGGGVSERVVNQLLTEMDGLDSRRSVFVIAATNRPELIDPAMMRPGRLDKLLYVPLPTPEDRSNILHALSGSIRLGPDVNLDDIGRSARAEGYSGADCAALLREAGLAVLKERLGTVDSPDTLPLFIDTRHFTYAFQHVLPSVSKRDQARYDRMRDRMARARSRGGVADDAALGTTLPVMSNGAVPDETESATSPEAAEPATSS